MNTTILILLILIAALFGIARIFLFIVEVEGWSMYPTYHHGDHLLAIRFWSPRWLRRNQVIIWKWPLTISKPEMIGPGPYVKRIVGLAGDELTMPVVTVSEPFDVTTILVQGMRTWHVPAGHCFVKGDSPGADSTFFGPIPLHCIRGVILTRLRRSNREPQTHVFADFPEQPQRTAKP